MNSIKKPGWDKVRLGGSRVITSQGDEVCGTASEISSGEESITQGGGSADG